MGLIFNTPATVEMLAKVNHSFGAKGLKRWRKKNRIRYFDDTSGDPQSLDKVADSENVYPDSGPEESDGKAWLQWLAYLHDGSQAGVGDTIRGYIKDGITDKTNCVEMAFVVKPVAKGTVITASRSYFPDAQHPYIMIITISTPTVSAIRATLKEKARRRAIGKKKV